MNCAGLRRDGSDFDMEVRISSYEMNGDFHALGLYQGYHR